MAQATGRTVPGEESDLHDDPHVEGRRITVLQIVSRVEDGGVEPEAVAEAYDLSLADVYRALTYCYDHPEEMKAVQRKRHEREANAGERGAKALDEISDERE